MTAGRSTLFRQILLLAAIVGVLAAAITGALSAGLVRADQQSRARQSLVKLADAVATEINSSADPAATQRRTVRTLNAIDIRTVIVNDQGHVANPKVALADAVTPADIDRLRSGHPVSVIRADDHEEVLVEGRPTALGSVVLLQRQQDAIGPVGGVFLRTLIAFAVAFAVAALLALFLSRRIVRPLRQTAGVAHALASGSRDVTIPIEGPTEVAELAEAINGLGRSLARSEAQQREFLLSVSHDLRTPLTAISGYAESLADGVIAPGETSAVGSVMLAESQRLTRMVADLLDIGRLEAGEVRVEAVPTDVSLLITHCADAWRNRLQDKNIELRTEIVGDVWATTDAIRLRQVVDGLLDNAARILPAGSPVVLAVRTDGEQYVLVEVRDGGPGLRDEDLPVAFHKAVLHDRYRDTRPGGSGLGLAIVQRLVTALGGQVEAGHAPEGGARFTIRLPIRA